MFVNFVDHEGDAVSFNVNHIVGFEFPAAEKSEFTLIQLITGKVAKVKEDRETIAEMFKQIYNHTNFTLWWDFQPATEQTVAPSP